MKKPGDDSQNLWADWDGRSDLPVGEILRRTRQHYNLELKDVAGTLRIRAVHLSALENSQSDQLPGRVYAIGFVRAYAEYLGLDGARMVHMFKAQATGTPARPELHFPVAASESKAPNGLILGGSAVIILVLLLLVLILGGGESKPKKEIMPIDTPRVAAAGMASPAPLGDALLSAMKSAGGEQGAKAFIQPQTRIVIKAVDSAWLEIRNAKGKSMFSRILKAGDSYLVPDEKGLKMDTGNAGVLELTVDGSKPFMLGEKGDVRRGVILEPETFAAQIVKEPEASESAPAGTPDTTKAMLEMPAAKMKPGGATEEEAEVPDALMPGDRIDNSDPAIDQTMIDASPVIEETPPEPEYAPVPVRRRPPVSRYIGSYNQ